MGGGPTRDYLRSMWEAFTRRVVWKTAMPSNFLHDPRVQMFRRDAGFLPKRPGGPADPRRLLLVAGDMETNSGATKMVMWTLQETGDLERLFNAMCGLQAMVPQRMPRHERQRNNAHNNFRWHCGCEQEQRPAPRRRERAPTRREQRLFEVYSLRVGKSAANKTYTRGVWEGTTYPAKAKKSDTPPPIKHHGDQPTPVGKQRRSMVLGRAPFSCLAGFWQLDRVNLHTGSSFW